MRLLGIIILASFITLFINKKINKNNKLIILLIINAIGTIFIFNDFFSIYGEHSVNKLLLLSLFVLINIFIFYISKKKERLIKVSFILSVLMIIYIELFNGILSFKNYNEFFDIRSRIGYDLRILPCKIVDMRDSSEGNFSSIYYDFFKYSEFKLMNNELYYRNPRYGETGIWFKYGIAESEQV